MVVYQRRTLSNITGSINNNLVRPPPQGPPGGASPSGVYQRTGQIGQQPSSLASAAATHYARPHLYGHDIKMRKCFILIAVCRLLFRKRESA